MKEAIVLVITGAYLEALSYQAVAFRNVVTTIEIVTVSTYTVCDVFWRSWNRYVWKLAKGDFVVSSDNMTGEKCNGEKADSCERWQLHGSPDKQRLDGSLFLY